MVFRFYTNAVSQASRKVAAGVFITGLLLIGFGLLVYILRDVFAIIAAMVFFAVGIGCTVTAARIFWAQRQFNKMSRKDGADHRENVQIHIKEHRDL
jgi:CHASE2 domain-containing sensor protein